MKKLTFFLILAASLMSCVYSRVIPLENKTYPSIAADEVRIFVDEEDLPIEFEKVAIITADLSSGSDKVKWNSVRKKSAKIGCNGVYQKFEQRASAGERIAGSVLGHTALDKAEFIAIRY